MNAQMFAILAAATVALQMALVIVRRAQVDEWPYLVLLGLDLMVLLSVQATHRWDGPVAYAAEAGALVLALAPRVLDRFEGRALAADRLQAALRLATVRELLVPGRTSARQRRQVRNLIEVRARGAAEVVRRLDDELARTQDANQAEALHEELIAMLLVDLRFEEAVTHFERHLGPAVLGRRLVLAPPLVRAYGELGRLDAAAALLASLEEGLAGRDPAALGLMTRARGYFLAYTGELGRLGELLTGDEGALVPARERQSLVAIARGRMGEHHSPEVRSTVALVSARALEGVRLRVKRAAPVTWLLIGANSVVYTLVLLLGGDGSTTLRERLFAEDTQATLVRAGGLFRPAVLAGEWWRLISAMFLHANLMHVALNMYGLYLLGRFTEELCGGLRYFVIYLLAGLAGAAASTLVGAGGLSVGASGAIMGLLGALLVILVVGRGEWPESSRRALLWNLGLLSALQIYIGFQISMIDNAAHVGGMVGGAAAALLAAPRLLLGRGRVARALLRSMATLGVALISFTLVEVVRTPLPATLARVATREVRLDGIRIDIPAYWEVNVERGLVHDPYFDIDVIPSRARDQVRVDSPEEADPRYRALVERVRRSARVLTAPVE
jgi:membrane associated rhomboid family serine protease